MTPTPSKFNSKLEKLSSIIEQLEQTNLSLEDSLKVFEEGIQLTKQAQITIAKAEQKVQLLLDCGDEPPTGKIMKEDGGEG